jgi:hypothetical protein
VIANNMPQHWLSSLGYANLMKISLNASKCPTLVIRIRTHGTI